METLKICYNMALKDLYQQFFRLIVPYTCMVDQQDYQDEQKNEKDSVRPSINLKL